MFCSVLQKFKAKDLKLNLKGAAKIQKLAANFMHYRPPALSDSCNVSFRQMALALSSNIKLFNSNFNFLSSPIFRCLLY